MSDRDTWKPELGDIKASIGLLTRLPVHIDPEWAETRGAAQIWAYPMVGVVLGAIVIAAALVLGGLGIPQAAIAFLIVGLTALITGGMHEDGFADCLDGFWGGWTPHQRLEVMKDSRVGVYAVVGLVVLIGTKAVLWMTVVEHNLLAAIGVLTISRAAMVPVMSFLPHARTQGLSASVGTPSPPTVALAVGIGAVIAILTGAWLAIVICPLLTWGFAEIARHKIGGQTGDVLGATQQITEIGALMAVAITV